MTDTTVRPKWGLPHVVPDTAIAAWGARLIITRDGDVDMVPDRQGGDGGPHTDELFDLLDARFSTQQMRDTIQQAVRAYWLRYDQAGDVMLFMDDRLAVHANTNASYGYCYVTAWLYEEPSYTFANEGRVDGVQYVTVLDKGGNPLEYNLPLIEAQAKYSSEPRVVAYTNESFVTESGDHVVALIKEGKAGYYTTTYTGSLEYCKTVAQQINDDKGYDRDTVLEVVSSSMAKGAIR